MKRIEFAGFAWPKQEWALPKGKPSQRVRKTRYTGEYYQNAPCMAGKGEISFYWGEGGEPSGRLWTLRAELDTKHAWYCDSFQEDAITPFVFALPHGKGWLPGWTMGEGMISSVDRYICMDKADAMNDARGMARIAAEKMREADQQYQADQQIEAACDSIEELRGSIQRVLEDRRKAQAPESLCEVLRSWVRSQLAEIRALRKRIALLEREPWQAVE